MATRTTKNSRHTTSSRTRPKSVTANGEAVMEGFHDAGRAAQKLAHDGVAVARDTAADYLEQGRARVRDAGDNLQQHVQSEPMKSLLIAAAAGFFFGAIWSRR
jgi:ElaB/YqjD/DUF883 family membrane-anchored ribosome-binding protein